MYDILETYLKSNPIRGFHRGMARSFDLGGGIGTMDPHLDALPDRLDARALDSDVKRVAGYFRSAVTLIIKANKPQA